MTAMINYAGQTPSSNSYTVPNSNPFHCCYYFRARRINFEIYFYTSRGRGEVWWPLMLAYFSIHLIQEWPRHYVVHRHSHMVYSRIIRLTTEFSKQSQSNHHLWAEVTWRLNKCCQSFTAANEAHAAVIMKKTHGMKRVASAKLIAISLHRISRLIYDAVSPPTFESILKIALIHHMSAFGSDIGCTR